MPYLVLSLITYYWSFMFCPICEAEYEPGITRCADDGAELVAQLSVDAGAGDDSEARFVPLHTLSSPTEAEMVNDILRQNGIRAVVQSGASDQFSPLFSVMSPGAQVLVDERDLDRARELYSSFFGNDTSPLTGPASEGDEENNV
jgi:Putative prokaryotic signal transducing protein